MHTTFFVNGKRYPWNPSDVWASGGEADIVRLGPDQLAKLYKPPDHPDLAGRPEDQVAAARRIQIAQEKLRSPLWDRFPARVAKPISLVMDRKDQVLGPVVPFVGSGNANVLMKYATSPFRKAGRIGNDKVTGYGLQIFKLFNALHQVPAVMGDANDLNVLIDNDEVWLIDSDSYSLGKWICGVYLERFVDPLVCRYVPGKGIEMVKPHNEATDFYAGMVMLWQMLTFAWPWEGTYRPKNPRDRCEDGERPFRHIWILNPEVIYPKPAQNPNVLPDNLMGLFEQVFVKDWRGVFPLQVLEDMRWTHCTQCGTLHARAVCPNCTAPAPVVTVPVKGKVSVANIFKTDRGTILYATVQGGQLKLVYRENNDIRREDGSTVLQLAPDPSLRWRVQGNRTLLGRGNQLTIFAPGVPPERAPVDMVGNLPTFDATGQGKFWITLTGNLMRDGTFGPEVVGSVLPRQTYFWVGTFFGLGFYRAGGVQKAFVFSTSRLGINDSVPLPRITGQLIDSTAFISTDRGWLLLNVQEGAKQINRCYVILPTGEIEASAEAIAGDGTWLGTLRGKAATGNILLAATDEGVVQVRVDHGTIAQTKSFPDTEPYVGSDSHLLLAPQGLYVVGEKEVRLIKLG